MILMIYGASGFGKEVYDVVMRSMPERWEKVYFIDDFADEGAFYLSERFHFDTLINKYSTNLEEVEGVIAVGEPSSRNMLAKRLTEAGIALTTIIDKTALISPTAQIGKGTIVCEMSSVHTGVVIGENCVIQPYVCVGHDTVVGNSTVLSEHCAPGGGITFGDCVFVGLNATIKERLNIENNAIVGMGAAVFKNVGENMTVAGNPARVTRGNDEHKVFK